MPGQAVWVLAKTLTESEREVMNSHAARWRPYLERGDMVVFGPVRRSSGAVQDAATLHAQLLALPSLSERLVVVFDEFQRLRVDVQAPNGRTTAPSRCAMERSRGPSLMRLSFGPQSADHSCAARTPSAIARATTSAASTSTAS